MGERWEMGERWARREGSMEVVRVCSLVAQKREGLWERLL
jgi:hypothetical protein